jgi:signal peptidase II
MKLSRRRWLALSIVAVLVLDWATKFWIQNRMYLNSHRSLVDGWLWLNHRQNRGISGSTLADLPDLVRTPLLAAVALVGIVMVTQILRSTRDEWTRAAASLVLAGAVGNLGDRLLDGSVTDFIVVRWFPYVFNVADIAITLGAVVLAVRLARAVEPTPPESVTPTPG